MSSPVLILLGSLAACEGGEIALGDDSAGIAESDTDTDTDTEACVAYGLVGDDSIAFENGSSVDGWDGRVAAYDSGHASNAGVAVNGAAACALEIAGVVTGDVWTGGDPATTVCWGYGGSVSGTSNRLASASAMREAELPSDLSTSEGDVTLAWGTTSTVSADTVYDSLTLAYGSAMTVDTSVRIVVLGNLVVDGTSLTITPGVELVLYVAGNVTVRWAGNLNSGGIPSQLKLVLPAGGTLTLDYGGALSAWVEQPEGAFVNSGGAFSGTWIGQSLTTAWGAATHVDSSGACE